MADAGQMMNVGPAIWLVTIAGVLGLFVLGTS